MKKRLIAIAAIVISCIFISILYFKPFRISIFLKFIPDEEKYFLEVFLRILISHGHGNYVLFGDKPASFIFFEDREKFQPETLLQRSFAKEFFSPIAKGFKIWKKYESFLLSKNFIIVETRSFLPDYCSEIFLIHRQRINSILEENFSEFRKVFPQFVSAKNLLNSIISESSILEQICVHDRLLGIFLGYGNENSNLFERESQIEEYLFPEKNRFVIKRLKPCFRLRPSSGFITLEDELASLRLKGGSILEPNDASTIKLMLHYPIGFLVDVSKTDIQSLRAEFKKQHRKSTQAYNKGNFLEVTLQYLAV